MEVYLNSIEMGDGIYGAEAVAQQHFGRPAKKLTRANCSSKLFQQPRIFALEI